MSFFQPHRFRVGQAVRDALQARLDRRLYLGILQEVSLQRLLRFDRPCLRLIGLRQELRTLLDQERAYAGPCRFQCCHLQRLADAVFRVGYAYVASVLDVFSTSVNTGVVVFQGPYDRLDAGNTFEGPYSYLLPDELTDLVGLVNETAAEVLVDERANFPVLDEEEADALPGICHTLSQYDCNSLCDLPITPFGTEQTFARYWADRYRFEVTELRVEADAVSGYWALTGRSSHWRWYCSRCLSDQIERYCQVLRQQRGRDRLSRAQAAGVCHG